MRYKVHYSCFSHIGRVRQNNQDNFICDGHYMEASEESLLEPLCGTLKPDRTLIGVFDGVGGADCGEMASYLSAKDAAETRIKRDVKKSLQAFCDKANGDVIAYAEERGISSMGTTAALLVFTADDVYLCNAGDSKIFRFGDGALKQISKDHTAPAPYGGKGAIYQFFGVCNGPVQLDPYFARGTPADGDKYLICSDGLTDMVSLEDIVAVLSNPEQDRDQAAKALADMALANGGRDNITIIVCTLEKQRGWFSR